MIDRRQFHRAVLGGLAAPLAWAPARVGFAADPGAAVSTVSDGNLVLPLDFFLPQVSEAELAGLDGLSVQDGTLTPPCNATLVRLGERLVLFDAGSGPNFMPTAGLLLENLDAAGVAPEEITDVIFTHAHPDHIWGVLDDFDEVVFPEAAFHISQAEWDYWRAEATLAATPEARQSFVVGARSRLAAIEDRIQRFAPGAEVVPGIEAMDASGHTPGHMAFVVHAPDAPVMVVGDALSNDPVAFSRPGWLWGADQDPEKGVATRRMLLDRLATEQMRFVGFHLPGGGMGRVERADGAYRYVPEG